MNFEHGTTGRYTQGCRCTECRKGVASAKSLAARKRRAESAKRSGLIPHGTADGYKNYDCRCDACKAAKHAEYLARKAAGSR